MNRPSRNTTARCHSLAIRTERNSTSTTSTKMMASAIMAGEPSLIGPMAGSPASPCRAKQSAGGHQQERRALTLVRQSRARRDLLFGRSPLLDTTKREADAKQRVDVGGDGPMLLDHAFG